MLLVLNDDHREHLSFLTKVSIDNVREFCSISLDFMQKGTNPKAYQTAAHKLGVDSSTVQHCIQGLTHLLTESSKLMLNELDFRDSIMTLDFSSELQDCLLEFFMEHREQARHLLGEMAMDLPHYHNMEWRFDVQLASRSLRHQVSPLVVLKLHLKDGEKEEVRVLQTDPVNLVHLTQTLEEAMAEMKTSHSRRIVRNI